MSEALEGLNEFAIAKSGIGTLFKAIRAYTVTDADGKEIFYARRPLTELMTVPLILAMIIMQHTAPKEIIMYAFPAVALIVMVVAYRKPTITVSDDKEGIRTAFSLVPDSSIFSLKHSYTVTDKNRIRIGSMTSSVWGRWEVKDVTGTTVLSTKRPFLSRKTIYNLLDGSGSKPLGRVETGLLERKYTFYLSEGAGAIDRRLAIGFGLSLLDHSRQRG